MPTLKTRLQQPKPVAPQVPVPNDFPDVPQSILDRFPEAAEWQKKLDEFWERTNQALQVAQQQISAQVNSQVIWTVDRFLIYTTEGNAMPAFALDDTGIRLGNVLVVNTPGRKVYIGAGTYQSADTPFYIDTLGKFSLGANLTWDPDTSTLAITGTITATSGSIGGFDIGSDYIRDTANMMGLASTVTGGNDIRFWAGATFANRATAPFRIAENGDTTVNTLTVGANGYFVNLIIKGSQLNEYATNAVAAVEVNYDGYQGGSTQFRNLIIYDGKTVEVGRFVGATKALSVVGQISSTSGGLDVAGTITAGSSITATGALGGSNFSGSSTGTNTGDQTLPTRASLGLATTDNVVFNTVDVGTGGYKVSTIKVVGAQAAAEANLALYTSVPGIDTVDEAAIEQNFIDTNTKVNNILAKLRTHGLFAT